MSAKDVELLAPVGKMEVLDAVIQAGADAVYLGGKEYNMRMLRPGFNFSRDELKRAVEKLHQQNKKLYITVNNLYTDKEMQNLDEYLIFLESIGADALIVQDSGLIQLHSELGLNIPIHGSVQMGLGNSEAINLLENHKVSRVILSKNVSLEEIKSIYNRVSVGIEYFVHGDLCISHTGQCYMSSFLFGDSGNQGRCHKPCRWQYELQGEKQRKFEGKQYFLAHNDLCLYPYIKDLVEAGVQSFKIEGRMRNAEFVSSLVDTYRRAIDRYLENPDGYEVDTEQVNLLEERRVRNYTTGNLFHRPGADTIGYDGEREPRFPTNETNLRKLTEQSFPKPKRKDLWTIPEITVRVRDMESLKKMVDLAVDNLIIGTQSFRQSGYVWDDDSINEALGYIEKSQSRLFFETPRIVTENNLAKIKQVVLLGQDHRVAGFIVNELGSARILASTGKLLWGGIGLNIVNKNAANFLRSIGFSRINPSPEFGYNDISGLFDNDSDIELMVHGPMVGMITDYCIASAVTGHSDENCHMQCMKDNYGLIDQSENRYQVRTDEACRNYIYYPHQFCLYQDLSQIMSWEPKSIRIEGQFYSAELLEKLVLFYRNGVQQISEGNWHGQVQFEQILAMFPEGLTNGPLVLPNQVIGGVDL